MKQAASVCGRPTSLDNFQPPIGLDPDSTGSEGWAAFPSVFRSAYGELPSPWRAVFGPLRTGTTDDMVVVGQIGQSLDGRIATVGGRLQYINGPAGLAHLHRLRALVDAVAVGIGTALADDPRLTVRNVAGPNPARIVIDPRGRVGQNARLFARDGSARIVVTAQGAEPSLPADIEIVSLPSESGHIAPAAILDALAQRGFRRVLIEGGSETISRFLAAGCLDRLHVVVAPIILGSGRPSCVLPEILRTDQAIRPRVTTFPLGNEVLFDCDLSDHRRSRMREKIQVTDAQR